MLRAGDIPKKLSNKKYSYTIVGCGHFGSRAAETLLKKEPCSKIIVVDNEENALEEISSLPVERIVGDGISFLNQSLKKDRNAYIIPAVPFHLVFEFILSQLKSFGGKRDKVPDLLGLPNPTKGFLVLAVNVKQSAEVALAFTAQLDITFPVPLDPDGKMARRYGVYAIPTNFIIDRQGTIREILIGEVFREEKVLRDLLKNYFPSP